MAIDTSGEWWVGSEPEDFEPYLVVLNADCYPVWAFRLVHCECGCNRFHLRRGYDVTQRICAACRQTHYVCREPEDWEEAEAEAETEAYACVGCGCEEANVGVGFSR